MIKELFGHKILRSTKNKQIILALFLFFASLLIGWKLFLKKDLEKINSFQKMSETENLKKGSFQNIEALENKIKNYRDFFVKTNETSWAIETLNQIAQDSGIGLSSIKPVAAYSLNKSGDYEKVSVEVETQCDYHSFGEFVSKLESFPQYLKIDSVRISSANSLEKAKPILDITLSISFFHAINKVLE